MTTATATEAPVVKVGDFFVCSWGYDQTNVDFYRVVGLTKSGKSVKVQKWSGLDVSEPDNMHDAMTPGSGPAMVSDWSDVTPEMDFWERQDAVKSVPSPVLTKRLRLGGYKDASFSVNDYSDAYLWDGKPEYQTGFGLGH